MNTSIFGACALLTLGASLLPAQAPQGKQPPPPMSFFITSSGSGKGGDLGGLAGADNRCQTLAAAVGSTFTWHAYLSTQAKGGQPAVNARDRSATDPGMERRAIALRRMWAICMAIRLSRRASATL